MGEEDGGLERGDDIDVLDEDVVGKVEGMGEKLTMLLMPAPTSASAALCAADAGSARTAVSMPESCTTSSSAEVWKQGQPWREEPTTAGLVSKAAVIDAEESVVEACARIARPRLPTPTNAIRCCCSSSRNALMLVMHAATPYPLLGLPEYPITMRSRRT